MILAVAIGTPLATFTQEGTAQSTVSGPLGGGQSATADVRTASAGGGYAIERSSANQLVAQDTKFNVDEFGLPLPAESRSTSQTTVLPVERWKREVAAIAADDSKRSPAGNAFSAEKNDDKHARFSAAFAEAKVPDCLHKDGLKRQPPRIGFFVFQGVLALPFVALAKVRGKCI
jgi:hypothetical protein